MVEPIYLNNDYYARYDVRHPHSTSGASVPSTGLILNIRLSATAGGAAIDSTLNKPAPELSSRPGSYACVFEGNDLATFLAGRSSVFVVVEVGVGDILCSNIALVFARRAAS